MAISHRNCAHPATPAGRRACRDGNTPLVPAPVRAAKRAEAAENARQNRAAGRSRRGGARVAPGTSACVQAALHVDEHGGRCACGWNAVAA